MNKIGYHEEMKLAETIILNGIIGLCDTYDENGQTIGIKITQKTKRLNGEYIDTVVDSFPFTKVTTVTIPAMPWQIFTTARI